MSEGTHNGDEHCHYGMPWSDPYSGPTCLCHGVTYPNRCGSTISLMREIEKDPSIKEVYRTKELERRARIIHNLSSIASSHETVKTINVFFHVIYHSPATNISNGVLQDQINVLNEDFRKLNSNVPERWADRAVDTHVGFAWNINDVNRIFSPISSWPPDDSMKYSSEGGSDAVSTDSFLNIWICSLGGGLLGFAYYPGTAPPGADGVVITNLSLPGGQAPFNLGRTATHEVGHYLNLIHIWGDGGCTVDDGVGDTPESDGPSYGCNLSRDSCPGSPDPDMVENYMDYSDDACMGLFTSGQAARMQDCLENDRAGIWSAGGGGGGGGGGGPINSNTIDFINASFMSVSFENQFLGDEIFHFRGVKNISIKGLIDSRNNTDYLGVSQSITEIQSIISNGNDYIADSLVVNGVNLGKGRITSLKFERENPVRIGEYSVEIQIPYTGDLSNLNGEYYNGVKAAITDNRNDLLEDLSESFDFNIGEDGGYEYSHDISIKYITGFGANPITLAKSLASSLFNTSPAFGFINTQYSGFYNAPGREYFTEDYDLVNYSFNFGKKLSLLDPSGPLYTLHNSRSLDLDSDGNINVSEQGEVKGLASPFDGNALIGANTEITNSFSRCNTFFNKFIGFTTGSFYALNSTALTVGKEINSAEGKVGYNVSYTNNPKINVSGFIHEYTLDYENDILNDEVKVTEGGTIRNFGNKSLTFGGAGAATFSSVTANSSSRASTFYQGVLSNAGINPDSINFHPLVLTSTSIEYPKFGGNMSYSKSYSNSTNLRVVGNLNKVEISISDNAPIPIKGNFLVPNQKEIIQDNFQTELGSRNVKITAIKNRLSQNYFDNPPDITADLNTLKALGLAEMRKIPFQHPNLIIKDIFINDSDYSFSSDGTITLSLSINYVGMRSATDLNPVL